MLLRRWFSSAVLLLVIPAASGWLAWDFHARVHPPEKGGTCDGERVGAIRINENGSPQICLPR